MKNRKRKRTPAKPVVWKRPAPLDAKGQRKRNATDATMRNVRATSDRVSRLKLNHVALSNSLGMTRQTCDARWDDFNALVARVEKLEAVKDRLIGPTAFQK